MADPSKSDFVQLIFAALKALKYICHEPHFAQPCAWEAFGTIISASYPIEKNLKRKKPHPEDETIPWYPVELRNFPHWTLCDDIKATILSLGPASQRVRVIHYDPEPSLSVARAYFREEEDRDATLKALAGHEISPGYILNAAALPRTKDPLLVKKG